MVVGSSLVAVTLILVFFIRDICLLILFEPLLHEKGMVSVNTVSLDEFWWVLVDRERVSSLSKVLKYKHEYKYTIYKHKQI